MLEFKLKKVGIFTDLHIGVHKDSKYWHDITWQWANWFIGEMHRQQIKDIIFCGDYFHTRDEVSVDTLHFGTKVLELFKDFNIVMIVGNHDCFLKDSSEVNSISPYSQWPNVTIVDKPLTVNAFGTKINFIPWGIKVHDIPEADITFGHFEIQCFRMNTYSLCDDGIVADDILAKSPLVISGHFHLRDEKKYSAGTILYAGNPFQMDFNDAGTTKGYYVLDLKKKEYEFVENEISPKHHAISLSQLISEQTITPSIRNKFKDNFVRLKIDRRITAEDAEFLINKLKSLNPAQFNVEYEAEVSDYQLDEEKRDFSGIDIQQAIIEFIDMMDTSNKKDLITYTIDLYQNNLK
jgi:DNA repair exonuclease SbcCD nuclease subunit